MNKRIIALLTVVFMLALSLISVSADEQLPFVIDGADLLTQGEEAYITSKLEEINKEFDLDIVVLTVPSLGDYTAMEFADDYYDYGGYDDDGALILVSAEEGERYVSTCGSCIDKIDVGELGDEISYLLDEGAYAAAFEGFADYVKEAYSFKLAKSLAISLIIGLVVALIVTSSMKGQLKSVRMQTGATNYLKADGLNITDFRDIFLYRTVTSRKREKSSSGGGTHTSSSGRSHGGGSL